MPGQESVEVQSGQGRIILRSAFGEFVYRWNSLKLFSHVPSVSPPGLHVPSLEEEAKVTERVVWCSDPLRHLELKKGGSCSPWLE